jgi:C_GCAxxG_C_C family probable redox protein
MQEHARDYFEQGFNCAQSVCAAYAEHFGLDREIALRVSAGFGGGMGRLAGTCGAVSGAFMIIGLKYGAVQADDKESKENAYAQVREFAQRFTKRHGSLLCKELLGCDISTPEGYQRAKEEQLFTTRCPQLVQDAAEILEAMMCDV